MRFVPTPRLPLLLLTAAGLLLPMGAAAQACVGLASFETRPLRINAVIELPDSAEAYAVGLGAGKPNGLFGTAGAGRVSYEGLEARATLGFAELGFQLPLGPVQLCPLAGGTYAVGPNDEAFGFEVVSWGGGLGAAAGLPLAAGPITLVPNLALRWEYVSQRIEERGFEPETVTYEGTVLDLALALLLADRLSLQPIYHLPLTSEDEEPSFGAFLSIAFGLP